MPDLGFRPRRAWSRRSYLLTAAGIPLALTGCRWGPEEVTNTTPPTGAEPATEPVREDSTADDELVASAQAALHKAVAALAAASVSVPEPIAEAATACTAAHQEHLTVLSNSPTPAPTPGPTRGASATRITAAIAAEKQVVTQLRTCALQARSGELARTFAAIAAGTDQHLHLLKKARQ